MTEIEAIENLKMILEEATEDEHSVCYVTSCDKETLEMAIKSLEKQMPKEVIEVDYALGETEYRCPSCNLLVSSEYCEECGQKIDWKLDI